MDVKTEILRNFPLLVPMEAGGAVYEGFVTAGSCKFRMSLHSPNFPSVCDSRIQGTWMTYQLLRNHERQINRWLKSNMTVLDFLKRLQIILAEEVSSDPMYSTSLDTLTLTIFSEVDAIGWDLVNNVNANFTELEFTMSDGAGREHFLQVQVNPQYPKTNLNFAADLPECFVEEMRKAQVKFLPQLYEKFRTQVGLCQDFWDAMDELDKNCWVVEPEKPRRCDCYRRIALGNTAYMHIIVNPLHLSKPPEITFMGVHKSIHLLENNSERKLQTWDPVKTLLNNLECTLEAKFPSPVAPGLGGLDPVECGICYSYRLENELPTESCDSTHCQQDFHYSCIYNWLMTLNDTYKSMNSMSGDCPYCSKRIECKLKRM